MTLQPVENSIQVFYFIQFLSIYIPAVALKLFRTSILSIAACDNTTEIAM